jgi:hypothetical protein
MHPIGPSQGDPSPSGPVPAGDGGDARRAALECPRCGYSVGAILLAEASSWPLESRCAECGCAFRWGDLFGGIANAPKALLEYSKKRHLWKALPLTLVAAIASRPLWRRLRMEHPIRWLRLLWGGPLIILLVLLAQTSLAVTEAMRAAMRAAPLVRVYGLYPTADGTQLDARQVQHDPVGLAAIVECTLAVITRPTDERSLVLPVYATMPTPQWMNAARQAVASMEPMPPLVERRMPIPYTVGVSPADCWRTRGSALPPPVRLAGLAVLLSVVSFVFLPIARRRAKVRVAHLLRATAYLLLGGIPILALFFACNMALTQPWSTPVGRIFRAEWNDLPILAASIAYLAWWWRSAAGDYLRMERPWAVGLSVATLALLAVMIIDIATGLGP